MTKYYLSLEARKENDLSKTFFHLNVGLLLKVLSVSLANYHLYLIYLFID